MSAMLKLLPAAALGLVAYLNADDMKKYLDIVGKVQVAATEGIEMQGIAEAVAAEYTSEGTLPLDNFGQFLKENMREKGGKDTRDRSKDLWGTDYRLNVKGEGFEVKSAGPDKTWSTSDDLNYYYSLKEIGGAGAAAAAAAKSGQSASSPAASTAAAKSTATKSASTLPTQSAEETKRKVVESQMSRAAAGSAQAQLDLGLRYLEGDGVEKDEAKGRDWLIKSAQGGNGEAERKLKTLGVAKP